MAKDLAVPLPRRPGASRHNSTSSATTARSGISHRSHAHAHAHAQQREYVPSNLAVGEGDEALAERWLLDQAEREAESEAEAEATATRANSRAPTRSGTASKPTPAVSPSPSIGGSLDEWADDWDNVRDGSISRRPAWRRPSPTWVLPFLLGVTLSVGMTTAPRAELYVDLACLAHPPSVPSSSGDSIGERDNGGFGILGSVHGRDFADGQWEVNSSYTSITPPPTTGTDYGVPGYDDTDLSLPGKPILSPGDKWFLKAQRDIYDHRMAQTIPPLPSSGDSDGSESDEPASPTPKPKTPYDEIDPRLCKKDPKVQAAAARLTMTLTVVTGLLSAMTTGYWASVSDRRGRRNILSTVELGLLLNDACFLLVASYPHLAPGGYYSLLIGPTFDGLLGGFSTITATMHAYISDVTPDGSRATAFARLGGGLMLGFALGPTLGSALIDWTGNILFPFYLSIIIHSIVMVSLRFVLPESLSTEARVFLTKKATAARDAARARDAAEREWEDTAPLDNADGEDDDEVLGGESGWSRISGVGHRTRTGRKAVGSTRRAARRAFAFLAPLTIFLPRDRDDGKKDYNLTCVGIVMFIMSMMYGILQIKVQYAFYQFAWTSTQLGPYISFMSTCRGISLLIIMPIAMYYLKPLFTEPAIIETQSSDPASSSFSAGPSVPPPPYLATENEPLLHDEEERDGEVAHATAAAKSKRSAALDRLVLRTCILFELAGYLTIALNVQASSFVFVLCSAIVAIGAPGTPAANSLALSFLPHSREAGRLFGGLAVIHALGATFISPILFGSVFASTVGVYAPAVFGLVSILLVLAQIAMLFIHLPDHDVVDATERGRPRGSIRRPA